MTLFAFLALPLFVVAAAARGGPQERGRLAALLPWFAGAALLAMPVYPLIDLLGRAFPPYYDQPRLLFLRPLALQHGAPLAAALAGALLLRRYRDRRRPASGLLGRAAAARRARTAAELAYYLATLGGFFSMFALLEQLDHYADPSLYRLILLPLLRVAMVSVAAFLLARTAGSRIWWRGLALLVILALPLPAAAVAYESAVQRTALAAAAVAAAAALALLPLLRPAPREVPDERT